MSQVILLPRGVWHGSETNLGAERGPRAVAALREAAGPRVGREPRQRATIALVPVVVLALLQVGLGAVVSNIWKIDLALGVACGGILGFAIIDLWLRPRSDDQGARRVRRFMPLWLLVPFLCSLGASAWVHYQQREIELRDIGELACDLANRLVPDSCKIEYGKPRVLRPGSSRRSRLTRSKRR